MDETSLTQATGTVAPGAREIDQRLAVLEAIVALHPGEETLTLAEIGAVLSTSSTTAGERFGWHARQCLGRPMRVRAAVVRDALHRERARVQARWEADWLATALAQRLKPRGAMAAPSPLAGEFQRLIEADALVVSVEAIRGLLEPDHSVR